MQWFIDIINELIDIKCAENKVRIHGQLGYFDRGDPVAHDFVLGDFTLDNTWRDLDLSAIVPADAQAVLLKINIRATVIQKRFAFRRKGNASEFNTLLVWSQVANIRKGVLEPIACDSDRVIQYKVLAGNVTTLDVLVAGWWLR